VLGDYYRNHPNARDSEVLSLFATIINKIGSQMTEVVPKVFEALFPCTLQMITQNMQDFPDHRIRFFNLLRAINAHAFRVFFQINQDQFKMVIDSVVWSFKHLETNIADAGLNTLLELLQNVERSDVVNQFYQQFCIPLLQDVFVVLTDLQHKPGFQLHASILAKMFSTVEKGLVTVPLWTDGQFPNNQVFMRQNLMQLIGNAFKNLSAADVQRFVEGLFALNSNIDAFRAHLRDFLVQFKEFSGDGLYQTERQQQAQRAEELERERVLAVPGLMYTGPSAVLNNAYRATDNDNDEE
jgi:exportin-1